MSEVEIAARTNIVGNASGKVAIKADEGAAKENSAMKLNQVARNDDDEIAEEKNMIDDQKTDDPSHPDEAAHLEKLSRPNCLTNLMVKYPCTIIIVGFLVLFIISAITVRQKWMMPSDLNFRDFQVWGSETLNQFDKSTLLSDELGAGDGKAVLQSQTVSSWNA